ncbi:MAG: hypothetical protein IPM06_21090 [Rhizobiales bacterium]|nr:hypothetical protein [Hyphomicrobiales bacterium]
MVTLVNMVPDATSLLTWAATAKPKETATYHVGNLAVDRGSNPGLHDMAEIVRLLQETGWLIQATRSVNLAAIEGRAYFTIRTGRGWAPRCVLSGAIDARIWRAMRALRDRQASQSSHRAIRDELGSTDGDAADVLALLYAKKWIEPAPIKGFQLSDAGALAML